MKTNAVKFSPFFISVAAVLTVTVAVIICVTSFDYCITFKSQYFFVCYAVKDNAVSAGAVSSTVSDYGGAGYVLEYNGGYYVTVACYYSENEADRVRQNLIYRGLECSVLKVETDEYHTDCLAARGNEKLYTGNLNTIYSLSKLCYGCANGLDSGECNQQSARAILNNVKDTLKGLNAANAENCFTGEIKRLAAECDAVGDYIYSRDMRKLQAACADTVINIKIY